MFVLTCRLQQSCSYVSEVGFGLEVVVLVSQEPLTGGIAALRYSRQEFQLPGSAQVWALSVYRRINSICIRCELKPFYVDV